MHGETVKPKSSVAVTCFLPGRTRTYQHPLYQHCALKFYRWLSACTNIICWKKTNTLFL